MQAVQKQKHSKPEIKPYKMHKGMKLLHLFELLVKSGFNKLQTTSKEKNKCLICLRQNFYFWEHDFATIFEIIEPQYNCYNCWTFKLFIAYHFTFCYSKYLEYYIFLGTSNFYTINSKVELLVKGKWNY